MFESLETRLNLAGDLPACQSGNELPEEGHPQAVKAINCLALDLYEQMREVDGNLFFSPTSVSTVLAMLYAGTDGATAAAMADSLYFEDEGIHDSFRALIDALERDTTHELAQANAIWPSDRFELRREFTDQIASDYHGGSQNLDYFRPDAKDTINEWVSDQTRGNIRDLIDNLEPSTLMTLTNAIYFNGLWEFPFPPLRTKLEPFTRADGTTVDVPIMDFTGVAYPVHYKLLSGFHLVELPYQGNDASMVIMVPSTSKHSAADVTPELLSQAIQWEGNSRRCIQVKMPKFNTTVSTDLRPLLAQQGMPMAGDFSRMAAGADLIVSKIGHKAFIEVNEQGTEAAAATYASLIACFAKGTPVLTPKGEKPIENLIAGDLVLARNEHQPGALVEPKRIEEVFQNRGTVISMRVGGQVIRTTPEHRFYEKERGWTAAEELKSGDQLSLAAAGEWMTVAEVDTIGEMAEVCNFRVADHHTYFVGSEDWGFALWTHNCYAETAVNANQPFHYFIRDNATNTLLFMGRVTDPSPSENTLTKTLRVVEPPRADTDDDLDTDFKDFLVLSQNFGKPFFELGPDARLNSLGDFNGDYSIDFQDFLILQEDFGRSYQRRP